MARSIVPKPQRPPRPPEPMDPAKAVLGPPRLKPISTRDYGKGGTPMSSAPDLGLRGAGIGYGGPKPFGS
jgi:hypothetical protein